MAAQARALEEAGFDGVFTLEAAHDVFLPLALAAQATNLEVTTNVAVALPRSPLHLAHAAYDLQTLSRGRFRLGLGGQVRPVMARMHGADWSKPVDRMRELVLATKAILACWHDGTPLDFQGEYYRPGAMPTASNPGPHPYGIPPVLVAALGPRTTRMAAEVADGLLVPPFHSRRFLDERVLPVVAEAMAASGRGPRGFEIVGNVIVATGRNEAEMAAAEAGVRALLAVHAASAASLPLLELEGLGDLHAELVRLAGDARGPEMTALIDADVMARFAVVGEPRTAADTVIRRCEGLGDRVGLYLPYAAGTDLLAALAGGFHSAAAPTVV